uniref:Putative secreted protein n=1 Tax=Ixodes ricinus TaxID=34613 RepID=V5H0W1_IXORI
MCRNISNMLFVLFAVVLGLAASKGEGSENNISECYRAVKQIGDIFCPLYGYNKSEGLIYATCELQCKDGNVKLPKEACPNDSLPRPCTPEVKNAFQEFSGTMRKIKDGLKKRGCRI